ncbi:MAG: ATPase, partial [Lysobacterales bacterium]
MAETRDIAALLRAQTPLILIDTPDEARVVDLFRHLLDKVLRPLYRWSITDGLRRLDIDLDEDRPAPDVGSTLRAIREARLAGTYVLFDLHPYLNYAVTQRNLREIVQREDCPEHTLVLVGHRMELPPELDRLAVRVPLRLPDAQALSRIVAEEIKRYPGAHGGRRVEVEPETVSAIVRNLEGLDASEARQIVRQLIHGDGVLDGNDLPALARLKFNLLNRSGHLHFEYDTGQFSDVAGLERLKRWVRRRRAIVLSPEPPPGLDPPRGVL